MMFKPDKPIESSAQDLLGTKTFSESLCNAILSHKEKDSLSVGLFGPWGTGKTSIINMVLEKMKECAISPKEKPIIVKFDPWNFSDQNQLISQFFKQLSIAINKEDYVNDASKIGKKLILYSNLIAPLTFVPHISVFALLLSKIFKSVGEASVSFGDTNKKCLEDVKNELNSLLAKQNRKIVVIIDDIDRLNNTEIRQVFQLVKSLGDFPNTIYILAFDKDVIINALAKVQEGPGSAYLEKVIQVPFELPVITKEKVEEYLFSQLNILLQDIPEHHFDKTYWGNIYHSGLKHFFVNIRDVTRYINVLQFSFQMVKREVNPVDFFAITGMQVFLPSFYYAIRENKDMFAGSFDSYSTYGRSDILKKEIEIFCTDLFKSAPKIPDEIHKDFLKRLFPKLEAVFSNTHYGSNWHGDWRKNCRVCSPDVFDIYFKLALPGGDISRIEVESTLSLANDVTAFKEALNNLSNHNRILPFLNRMEDYTREDIPIENIKNIVTVLMDIGDKFPDVKDGGMFSTDTPMRLLRIFYQLSNRFTSHDERFEIFKYAMTKAEESLFTVVHETSIQGQQHGKNSSKENPEPLERRTVSEEQLTLLENIACEKIKKWAENKQLSDHAHMLNILYRWKEWGDINDVNNFVSDIIVNDSGLVRFLSQFLIKVNSHGISDYVVKSDWRLKLEDVAQFLTIDEIEPRLRAISNSAELKNYEEKDVVAIKTFLDTCDGKIKSRF